MAEDISISSREELEAWLEDKPGDWAGVIALRAALRVFPLVFTVLDAPEADIDTSRKRGLILQSWRAIFISSAAGTWPADEMRRAVDAAASAAGAAADAAASAAVDAAASAAVDAAASAAYAARAAADAAASAASAAYAAAFAARAAAWEAIEADCLALASAPDDAQATDLLRGMPLWIDPIAGSEGYATNAPESTRRAFDGFANLDWVRGHPWALITDWYAAILPDGRDRKPRNIFANERGRTLALQPDDFWTVTDDRSPDEIMEEVAEVLGWEKFQTRTRTTRPTISAAIERYLRTQNRAVPSEEIIVAVADAGLEVKDKSVWDSLSRLTASRRIERVGRALYRGIAYEEADGQPRAPFNFGFVDYQFSVVVPDPDLTVSAGYRDDMWLALLDALRRQAAECKATNAFVPDALTKTLQGLSNILGESAGALRPGVLQSHWRLMARQMARLASNGGTGSDTLDDMLDDVADALEDLRSCYRDIRQQEVEMVRLGVTARNVHDVASLLRQIVDVLHKADPALLPAEVRGALAHNLPLIESAEDDETRADIAADQVLTDQAFGIVLRKAIADFGRDSLSAGRDDLVSFAGKLPRRAVQASLAVIGLNYLGVLDQLAVHIPNLEPLLKRFRKLQDEGSLNPETGEGDDAAGTDS